MNARRIVFGLIGTAVASFATTAEAVCQDNDATTSQADVTMSSESPCGQTRIDNLDTMKFDYDMVDDDWGGRGNAAACNTDTELAKHLNAFLLIGNGFDFQPAGVVAPSFHSTWVASANNGDYLPLTSASSWNDWHDWFRHQVVDSFGGGTIAKYVSRHQPDITSVPDLLQTSCSVYDDNLLQFGRLANANPTTRAAILVHEGLHGWENKHGKHINSSCGHQVCPSSPASQRSLTCAAGAECDTWFPHGFSNVGDMNNEMHRPYQAMVEFACDLTDNPTDFVPDIAIELAAEDADYLGTNDILNGPMPACFGFQYGQRYAACSNGTQCDQATPCAGGGLCNPQTGCCTTQFSCSLPGGTTCDGSCLCDFNTGCCQAPPSIDTTGMTENLDGVDVCLRGAGFTPNASVVFEYTNVPGRAGVVITVNAASDANGVVFDKDLEFDKFSRFEFCTPDQLNGTAQVSIKAIDLTSKGVVTFDVPAAYWCLNSLVSTNFNGGCN